jgi:myosin heavy subunit
VRNPVQVALIAVIAVLVATTATFFVKYRDSQAVYASTKAAEAETRGRYEATINAIAEIQDSLDAITPAETKIATSLETEQKVGGPDRQQVLDRITVLRASIQRNLQRIQQLESSLAKNQTKVSGLQRMIANLKKSVEEKEELVAQLNTQVETLNTQVTGLETEVQQGQETIRVKDETLEERRRELATVYYVVGSKNELKKSGVIEAKGGVLGMGKTVTPTGNLDATVASRLDTDTETVITIPTEKAKVLTPQPQSSYELVAVGKQLELRILNPTEFRKVRQLVILTS